MGGPQDLDPTEALKAVSAMESAMLTLRRGLEAGNRDAITTALLQVHERCHLALAVSRNYVGSMDAVTP